MEIWVIRHGQTNFNSEGKLQGRLDIELNEKGLNEAKKCAAYVFEQHQDIPFTAIYASDLKRAHRTAQETADLVSLDIQLDERLREIDLGEWSGEHRTIVDWDVVALDVYKPWGVTGESHYGLFVWLMV
eukprot:TRINITY_DN1420_c0_g1_i4.p1 TRINITY_DN1420_c0_g1~~TRINITY_DN1420_c0_g1_i4.p1  ORF type:complete len:129 (-),score=33.76 TRINITY_DN1420_c0_g1_i4:281-667(-)